MGDFIESPSYSIVPINNRENLNAYDGRKLALDQRLINDMLPDDENSKASTCVEKAFEIWEQTKEQKSTQLIFCDLSTTKGDGTFNVYEDIRNKLIEKGVPPEEIAFIHEANTELRKAELFRKSKKRTGPFFAWFHTEDGSRNQCAGQTYRTAPP